MTRRNAMKLPTARART